MLGIHAFVWFSTARHGWRPCGRHDAETSTAQRSDSRAAGINCSSRLADGWMAPGIARAPRAGSEHSLLKRFRLCKTPRQPLTTAGRIDGGVMQKGIAAVVDAG